MALPCLDANGRKVMLIDPEGVYVLKGRNEPGFAVFSQQRMKRFRLNLIQGHDGNLGDVLICGLTGRVIPLETENGILVLRIVRHGGMVNGQAVLPNIMCGNISAAVEAIGEAEGSQ